MNCRGKGNGLLDTLKLWPLLHNFSAHFPQNYMQAMWKVKVIHFVTKNILQDHILETRFPFKKEVVKNFQKVKCIFIDKNWEEVWIRKHTKVFELEYGPAHHIYIQTKWQLSHSQVTLLMISEKRKNIQKYQKVYKNIVIIPEPISTFLFH